MRAELQRFTLARIWPSKKRQLPANLGVKPELLPLLPAHPTSTVYSATLLEAAEQSSNDVKRKLVNKQANNDLNLK